MVKSTQTREQTLAFHARLAGGAGLVPFVAPLLVLWWYPAWHDLAITTQHGYAALILSFLGGIYWGVALHRSTARWIWLSVLPTLWAWPALLLPAGLSASMLASGFVLMTLLDTIARREAAIREWFFRLRLTLSAVATVCLVAGMFV
ncbi:MAG: DUF3429 domain-containing protein [Guyparkeria sp.]